jgi:hypothetical protein
MSFTGSGHFTIKNDTDGDIENVRVTHFLKGDNYAKDSELAIIEKLEKGHDSEKSYKFQSIGGKDDHWCVAFQNTKGCWQSHDLHKSMSNDFVSDGYKLIIENHTLIFSAKNKSGGMVTADKKITTVFDAIKS